MNAGMLEGVRVVEVASENGAFAGKLLAGMGAEVVLVEPPDGHPARWFEPFVEDDPGLDRSLWWWHYQAGKKSITVDPGKATADLLPLLRTADALLVGSLGPGCGTIELDESAIQLLLPGLIIVSVTPFGPDMPRSEEQATDLTVLAAGGPVWSCGYDDHALPPVRPGGNQGYQIASVWAVMGMLAALAHRDAGGGGQRVDVSMHAAANVTCEQGTYEWLVQGTTVQRQTGRHASSTPPTLSTNVLAGDGRWLNTGMPPRARQQFRAVVDWLNDLGLYHSFDDAIFLEMGAQHDRLELSLLGTDAEVTAMVGAGREALCLIASKLTALEFFNQAQARGFTCAVVNAPEDLLDDPHLADRGFFVPVEHDGRTVLHPGAPFVASGSDWRVAPAPRLGEHTEQLWKQLSIPHAGEPEGKES
jgi:crotonobetainyl-CoA:carnitine CoA-transferase CaiB-like acyl-CoA transferase